MSTYTPTYTESQYLEIYPDPAAKLIQVRLILEAYDTLLLTMISEGIVTEYLLDDGQVRIQRKFGSLNEINASRLTYEQLANRLKGQMEGHTTKFIPCHTLRED